MSTHERMETACPNNSENSNKPEFISASEESNRKKSRKVSFPPNDEDLVSQYFEAANPWQDIPPTSPEQLSSEYVQSCRLHRTEPLASVLKQIKELPAGVIGGCGRAGRFSLAECEVRGARPVDALEPLLKKVQFHRIEVEYAALDDDAAEALFDMVEYYESATVFSIIGRRDFGIRGWQAASRMVKHSVELNELEISWWSLETNHAPVLARALSSPTCALRCLTLQAASLAGDALLCLVVSLKCNTSVRELRIGDNELTAEDAYQLGSLLRVNRTLQLLDLSNNRIQDMGVKHISEALVQQAALTPPSGNTSPPSPLSAVGAYEFRGLSYLVLWNNQLTRNCAAYLSKALRVSKSLCVLNIGRNPVGVEGVKMMREAALVSGGLQAVRLGPDAAPHLVQLLTTTKTLQRLDLRENKLGDVGLEAILSAMKENHTLTQIDLDDVPESSSLSADPAKSESDRRLVREIRALCRNNVPLAPPPTRPHRKISLTCHTRHEFVPPPPAPGRLRSPAPSPTASPTPPHHRFSVTRVTPDRDSESSPSTPTSSSPTSRFTVMQVKEPPKIQVHTADVTAKRKTTSRFSVTRNYDSVYETNKSIKPSISEPATLSAVSGLTEKNISEAKCKSDTNLQSNVVDDVCEVVALKNDVEAVASDVISLKSDDAALERKTSTKSDLATVKSDILVLKPDECLKSDAVTLKSDTSRVKDDLVLQSDKIEKSDTQVHVKDTSEDIHNVDLIKNVNICKLNDVFSSSSHVNSPTNENVNIIDANVNISESSLNEGVKSVNITTDLDSNIRIDTKVNIEQTEVAYKQIEAITEDLGNLIKEMKDLTIKTVNIKNTTKDTHNVPEIQVLKKNKSDTSLDLNYATSGAVFNFEKQSESKKINMFSQDSSIESTSDATTQNYLNLSLSSDDSISPILYSKTKKIHGSISSLEASVSSLDSNQKAATSSDSGVEFSKLDDYETLTHNSGLKELSYSEDTLTNSPKRTSSLLDVPALRNKVTDRARKISLVTPSVSQKAEPKTESKLPSHLEKLLSLFQHPSSIFSRSTEDNKSTESKKKEISSSFWNWGASEKTDRDEGACDSEERKDTSSESTLEDSERIETMESLKDVETKTEVTDSHLEDSEDKRRMISSDVVKTENIVNWNETGILDQKLETSTERVQLWYVDEAFSKKLDSKTPSSDTDTTVSEKSTEKVQLVDSKVDNAIDLNSPNDYNKNICENLVLNLPVSVDTEKNIIEKSIDVKADRSLNRPRTFAAVLKSSDTENLDRQTSPETATNVDKLNSKVIREIKENISPENTITASMSNELEMQLLEQNQTLLWEIDKSGSNPVIEDLQKPVDVDQTDVCNTIIAVENIDLGKDALSYLTNEIQDFDPETENESNPITEPTETCIVLAEELKNAENKEKMIDISPELVIEDEVFDTKTSIIIPERANFKSNSLEDLSQLDKKGEDHQKISKCLSFKEPEGMTSPRDIPERRHRTKSGSSPKSLPDCLNKTSFSKIETGCCKKKKKVSSLGKIARDSLLALNMSEDEIAEFRRSYKLTSVESLRSLESVSEDANASGYSDDSRCKSCLRASQESLMSLDSINEDCKCDEKGT